MKQFSLVSKSLVAVFFLLLLVSCKKDKEKFDSPPLSQASFSFTFDPNIAGTLTTDYTYNFVYGDGHSGNGGIYNQSDEENHNYRYTLSTILDHQYVNASTKLNTYLSYNFYVSFVPDASLAEKTYTYTTTSTSNTSVQAEMYAQDLNGNDYGWKTMPSNVASNYSPYPNCQTIVTISNIYTRKLDDGQTAHTYADGAIDITMLGESTTDLNGVDFENNPNFTSQLHLKYNFQGLEITRQ